MRLLLCGGGTAGHVNPAIAIAEELKRTHPDSKILFIGRDGGDENKLVTDAGFKLQTLVVQGIQRSLSINNLKSIKQAIEAVEKAKRIIKEFKPDIILGTGGYVCWPVITAGYRMKIPTAIHESNIIPGLTTKLLSKKCKTVFLNKEETKKYFNDKIYTKTVGIPLRQKIMEVDRQDARRDLKIKDDDFLIVSFGGSIGSEKMNDVIIEVMKNYSSKKSDVKHIHAVGKRYFKNLKIDKKEFDGCKILPFIDFMPLALKAADIVICRCGAITLAEVCCVGVPAILIPSPNVTANHQFHNGKHIEKAGGAILLDEKNLTEKSLINAIIVTKNAKSDRKTKAKKLKALSTPDAAKNIIYELFSLKNSTKNM